MHSLLQQYWIEVCVLLFQFDLNYQYLAKEVSFVFFNIQQIKVVTTSGPLLYNSHDDKTIYKENSVIDKSLTYSIFQS